LQQHAQQHAQQQTQQLLAFIETVLSCVGKIIIRLFGLERVEETSAKTNEPAQAEYRSGLRLMFVG